MTYIVEIDWSSGDYVIRGNDDFIWSYHMPTPGQIEAFDKMIFAFYRFNTTTADARRALDALVGRRPIGHGG